MVNEYLEDFHRGDFLIRNLLGADPRSGSIAVGALPRSGQTMQFQRRSAAAAMEDMDELLERAAKKLARRDDLRRLPVQLQRPRPETFRPAESRREKRAGPVRADWSGGIFLQRRNRADRRKEFSARLHGVAGVVCEEIGPTLALQAAETWEKQPKLQDVFRVSLPAAASSRTNLQFGCDCNADPGTMSVTLPSTARPTMSALLAPVASSRQRRASRMVPTPIVMARRGTLAAPPKKGRVLLQRFTRESLARACATSKPRAVR